MSVETQHPDDSSTDKQPYEQFTVDSGTVHYKTDKHHIGVTTADVNYLYLNDDVDEGVESSIRFTDIEYRPNKEDSHLGSFFKFKFDGVTTASIYEERISEQFKTLLFDLIHD